VADGERCRPLVDDNGQVVASVHGAADMDDRARRALLDVVAAAHRLHDSMPPPTAEEQARIEAARARNRERNRRWRGEP
jgi:hypothetical protein